jgi:hypothetical protein
MLLIDLDVAVPSLWSVRFDANSDEGFGARRSFNGSTQGLLEELYIRDEVVSW